MSDNTKRYLAWVIVVVAILVAGVLGMVYPLPEPPAPLTDVPVGMPIGAYSATGAGEGYTNLTSLALSDDLYVGDDASVIGDLDAATLDIAGAFDIDGAVTLNSTLDVDGATTLNSTLDVDGNVSSGTGAFTVTDDVYITGAMQIVGAISNPTYYITIADHVDIQNTLNYGTANLYPVGAEDSNFQWSWGSDVITGSLAVSHKVGTPTVASTASAAGVEVGWLVIGIP